MPGFKILCLFPLYIFKGGKYVDYLSIFIYQGKIKCKVLRVFDKPKYFDSECGYRGILFNEK